MDHNLLPFSQGFLAEPVLSPSCSHLALVRRIQMTVQQHNRVSRFTDFPGQPAKTLTTELVLSTSTMTYSQLHSSG